jgi:hypothetical protein
VKFLLEVLDWPVATRQTLRLPVNMLSEPTGPASDLFL